MNHSLCPDVFSDPSCSGRGICVESNFCACTDSTWTGMGDLAFGSPSCAVHLPTIIGLNATAFAASVLGLPIYVWLLYLRIVYPKRTDNTLDSTNFACALGTTIFSGITGLLRALHPIQVIGTDPLVTIICAVALLFLSAQVAAGTLVGLKRNVATMAYGDAKLKARLLLLDKYMIYVFTPLFAACTSGICITMLFCPTYDAHYKLTIAFFLGVGVLEIGLIYLLIAYYFNIMIELLEVILIKKANREGSNRIAAFLTNFKQMKRAVLVFNVPQVALACFFAFVPVLNRAAPSYWLPITWFSFQLLTMFSIVEQMMITDLEHAPLYIRFLHRLWTTKPELNSNYDRNEYSIGVILSRGVASVGNNNEYRLLIVREDSQGQRGMSSVIQEASHEEVDRVVGQGELLSDNGDGVVNIQSKRTVVFQSNATLASRLAPRMNAHMLRLLRRWMACGQRAVLLPFTAFTLAGMAIGLLCILNVIPSQTALFFAPVTLMYITAWLLLINLDIMKLVASTPFFWIRLLSAVVSCTCLCIVLADERVCIVLALFALQVFVAAGDAASGELVVFRVVFLVQLVMTIVGTLVVIFLDLIPNTAYVAVYISPSFDYALIQLGRDLLLGTLVVALFDLTFALRGANRRFQTIHSPIKFVVRTFEDEPVIERIEAHLPFFRGGHKGGYNVSKAQIKSGFIVAEDTSNADSRKKIMIYIDVVCLRQRDAVICHFLGQNMGERAFKALHGRIGSAIDLAVSFLLLGFFGSPWLPILAFSAVPFILVYPVLHISLMSWSMIKLIAKRRQFQVQLTFTLIFCGVWVSVFQSVQAISIILLLVVTAIDLFRDASLRKRSRWLLVKIKLGMGVYLLFAAACLVWNAYGDASHSYLDFRPDTRDQTADLGISLGVGHILTGLLLLKSYQPSELTTIHMPVTPVFDEGALSPFYRASSNPEFQP